MSNCLTFSTYENISEYDHYSINDHKLEIQPDYVHGFRMTAITDEQSCHDIHELIVIPNIDEMITSTTENDVRNALQD